MSAFQACIVYNFNPRYYQLVGERNEITITFIQGAKMKHLSLLGAIASARLSNANSQSQCINQSKLIPLLVMRPRTLAAACGLFLALAALPAHAQTCVQQPPGMIAWWPLDNSPDDIVGTNNPPSSAGAITYAPGMVGAGVDVSLTPLGISVLRTPSLNLLGSDFSIDAWVNIPKNSPAEYRTIFENYGGVPAYGLYVNLNNKAAAYFRPGVVAINGTGNDPFVEAVGTIDLNDGQWHHLVAVRSGATPTQAGATASIYVDGNLEGTGTNSAVLGVNGGSVDTDGCLYARIGATYSGPGYCVSPTASPTEPHFRGVIDEVEIFNRALDPSEIKALYLAASAGKCKPKGMTWHVGAVNPIDGSVTVGCTNCNPYTGDRPCTDSLPLLCFKPFTPRLPVPASVNEIPFYNRWSGGIVGTTAPVQASSFNKSLALANKACAQEFDPGNLATTDWRVAEFHDGANGAGGWNFQAYGNVGNPSSRFWVHINDQPNGTCWPKP
jgi:Concanavalin A-like lectin/glucanases superfamily